MPVQRPTGVQTLSAWTWKLPSTGFANWPTGSRQFAVLWPGSLAPTPWLSAPTFQGALAWRTSNTVHLNARQQASTMSPFPCLLQSSMVQVCNLRPANGKGKLLTLDGK